MSTLTMTKPSYLMALRAVVTLQTVTIFAASVTAGLLLSAPGGKVLHSATAYTLFGVALVHVVTAILAWRPGGGSTKPMCYAIGFLVGTLAQVALGLAHLKALHVPLGVSMFGASVLQLAWVWASDPLTRSRDLTVDV